MNQTNYINLTPSITSSQQSLNSNPVLLNNKEREIIQIDSSETGQQKPVDCLDRATKIAIIIVGMLATLGAVLGGTFIALWAAPVFFFGIALLGGLTALDIINDSSVY
jgi:hypothetical protein